MIFKNRNKKQHYITINDFMAEKYSIIIALIPILGIYVSGIPGINLAEFFLIFFTIICLMINLHNKKKTINKSSTLFFLLNFVIWILFSLLTILAQGTSLGTNELINILVRVSRYSFYTFCVCYTSFYWLKREITEKWIVKISILATLYLLMQYISYFWSGYILKSFIPYIPIYSSSVYGEFTYNVKNFYRPASFFIEPSHIVQYTFVGLIFVLFNNHGVYKKIFLSLLISTSLLLSTSLQGIVIMIIIWGVWWLRLYKNVKTRSKFVVLTVIPIIIFVISISLFRLPIIQNTLSRLKDSDNLFTSNAFIARFQGYSFFENLPNLFKWIGMGYGNIPSRSIFMSSLSFYLYCGGLISILFICVLFLHLFNKSEDVSTKVIILTCIILMTSAEWIYVYLFVFYFSLMTYESHTKKNLLITNRR